MDTFLNALAVGGIASVSYACLSLIALMVRDRADSRRFSIQLELAREAYDKLGPSATTRDVDHIEFSLSNSAPNSEWMY